MAVLIISIIVIVALSMFGIMLLNSIAASDLAQTSCYKDATPNKDDELKKAKKAHNLMTWAAVLTGVAFAVLMGGVIVYFAASTKTAKRFGQNVSDFGSNQMDKVVFGSRAAGPKPGPGLDDYYS